VWAAVRPGLACVCGCWVCCVNSLDMR
jgi:hypothetical protein